MDNPFAIIAAAATAILSAVFGFILKGQVKGTDADLLWKEARAIRDDLRTELEDVRSELEVTKRAHASCEADIGGLRNAVASLEEDRGQLRRAVATLQADRDTLTHQVERLEHEGVRLRQDNERLKKGVSDLNTAVSNGGAK